MKPFLIYFILKISVAKTPPKKHPLRITQNVTALQQNSTDDFHIEFYHLNANDSLEKRISLRQRRGPCACLSLNCGCCAGMETQKFKRKRTF